MVGLIRRSFSYMDRKSFNLLYKSRVRPVLEYANTIWCPRFSKDSEAIENVQRRATKMVPGLGHLSYHERLQKLRLPSLIFRRARGDMIETFKYLKGFYQVDLPWLRLDASNHTRGHSLKLSKKRSRLELRKHCFSNRVVNKWNSLPEEVVSSDTLNMFKNRLDKHWSGKLYTTESWGTDQNTV